jgi:hypothetical protein
MHPGERKSHSTYVKYVSGNARIHSAFATIHPLATLIRLAATWLAYTRTQRLTPSGLRLLRDWSGIGLTLAVRGPGGSD